MSISSISSSAAALTSLSLPAAASGIAGGSDEGGLIANVEADSADVSAAIGSISSTLGSLLDITA